MHMVSPPRLPSLLWYSPDGCQWLLNEEDELQRQLVQRQLAWTRRQTEQRGKVRGGGFHGSAGPALCMYMTGTDQGWQKTWLFDSVSGLVGDMCVFAGVCLSFHMECFLSHFSAFCPAFHHVFYPAVAILGHLLFGMLHLPAGQHLFPSLSVLPWPFSCWLTQALRTQVRSTTFIQHKKIPKLFLFPPSQSFNAPFCAFLDDFVQDPPNSGVFGVRRAQGVHWFCTTNLLSHAFWVW